LSTDGSLMTEDSMQNRYLQEIKIPLRLSCVDEAGWPVVLSLWFLYEGGSFYCATPERARVVSYLRREPRCAFEVAADQPPYCGVRGRAVATIDRETGIQTLERLLIRYVGSTDNPLAEKLLNRDEAEVTIRLEPQSFHSWNFSERMKESTPVAGSKPCP
jgi:nitroimidazol reductase NimA-like FMN-containing flavoprotein (pyridoxamine 5'-phosphate oxidase superfamily)